VHQPPADRGQRVQALKQHLRAHVPAYMVPGTFVWLDALPQTPNGKIDRQALPEPDRQRTTVSSSYVAPATDFERIIADTWQDLLAVDRVGTHDNFFDLGANSLLMVQAHASLRERLARPLSLVDLFRFPTVSTLAGYLGQAETTAASAVLDASEARAQARIDALGRRRPGRQAARPASPTAGTTT
jgi:acyl carrier protein